MKKVIWPTKKELINYTVMVIVATIVVMVIIGVADGVFSQLFKLLQLVSDRGLALKWKQI